jgi:hypothetical protein
MQEIPPDLGGWLADEVRTREEKDEDEEGAEGSENKDPEMGGRGEYFDLEEMTGGRKRTRAF